MDETASTMSVEEQTGTLAEIPRQIFDQFLQKLPAAGVSPDVIARLKKVILEDGVLSDKAIRTALFPGSDAQP